MKYHLTDIYNINELQQLCQSFTDITDVVTAILDLEGNVIVATGWKDICTKFHRVHPESQKLCTESDTVLAGQLKSGCKYNAYKCKNGLMDVAMPIIVGDNHVGNFFTGQFLTEEPDLDYFRSQAKKYGFDENSYMDALADVPVFSEEQIESHISFLVQFTETVGNIGLKNLVAIEQNKQTDIEKHNLQKINEEYERLNKEYIEVNEELITARKKAQESEQTYRMLFQNLTTGFALHEIILDDAGKPCDYRFLEINPAFEILTGMIAADIVGKTVMEVLPQTEQYWIDTYGEVALKGKNINFENYSKEMDKYYQVTSYSPEPGKFATIFLDITARKKTEIELREIKSRFEEAERDALLGHWTLHIDSGELSWSNQIFRIFEIDPDQFEATYEAFLKVVHPDDREMVDRTYTKSLQDHTPYEISHRLIMPDGRIKWVCEKCTFDFDDNGCPLLARGIVQDVTEQKLAEEALQASEQDLKESQRIAHVGSWHLDIASNTVVWSEELYKMYGFDPTKPPPPYNEHKKLFTPDSWDKLTVALDNTANTGYPYELELETVHEDGSHGWMWVYGKAEFDANGKITGLFGAAQDITERKKIEESLRESRTTLDLVLNTVPQSIFWKDVNGCYLGCNKVFATAVGLDEPAQVVGMTDFDMPWPREEAEAYRDDDRFVLENVSPKFHIIEQVEQADGTRIWVDTSKVPLCDDEGEPFGILGVYEDITERKKVESVIQRERCFTEAIFESIPGILYVYDDQARLVRWNKEHETFTGYSAEELSQMTSPDWHPEEERAMVAKAVEDVLTTGYGIVEAHLLTKDGRNPLMQLNGVRLSLDDKIYFVGIGIDITERKQVEEEINQLNAELEQRVQERTEELRDKNEALEQAISRLQETQSQLILFEKMTVLRHLISGIAHEINNPLGAIESSREMLERDIGLLVSHIADICQWLKDTDGPLLAELMDLAGDSSNNALSLSFSEKRKAREVVIDQLKENGIEDAHDIGAVLVEFNVCDNIDHFLPLLRHKDILEKLGVVRTILDSYVACNTIKAAVSKSSKIVNALRSYTRKEEDTPDKVVSDIRGGIETVLQLFQNTFKFFAELEFDCDDDIPSIPCYPDQLNQVWTNLIQNALHAMDNKGKLRIEVKSHNNGVLIRVIDQGCGMTPEIQARVFEPLFTTKPAGEGIGLGMDIVHMIIVERHNGTIDIDSEPGKGTVISVFLPSC